LPLFEILYFLVAALMALYGYHALALTWLNLKLPREGEEERHAADAGPPDDINVALVLRDMSPSYRAIHIALPSADDINVAQRSDMNVAQRSDMDVAFVPRDMSPSYRGTCRPRTALFISPYPQRTT